MDGSWLANITTGSGDPLATRIAAYLVPATYAPPLLGGESVLPPELAAAALASLLVERGPGSRLIDFSGYT